MKSPLSLSSHELLSQVSQTVSADKHDQWLPLLDNSQQFQAWALKQNQLGNIEVAIALLLEQQTELATFRAACLGHWFVRPNTYRDLLKDSLEASDPAISLYAQSYLTLLDFVESRHQASTPSYWIPLLEDGLVKLEVLEKSDLVREAKTALLTNLGLIKSALGQHDSSRTLAAQAVFLARQIRATLSEMRASNLLIQANLIAGQVCNGLQGIQQSPEKHLLDHHAATYQQVSMAGCLTHLGDLQGALRWLDQAALEPVNLHAVNSVRQWFGCLGGLDDPAIPVEDRYTPTNSEQWIVYGLRKLLAAKSQPRLNKTLTQRQQNLSDAVQIARSVKGFASDWYFLLNRWISASAILWQGKATLSAHSLSGLKKPAREWLELRLLLAGLRLEQALDLNLPGLAIEPAEQELLAVLTDAESIPMASPTGLADLLMFWHPLAAVYMAVAFPNLPQLSPALGGILRLGSKNSANGKTVSPALASELLLRSLNLDLVEGHPLPQVKLGAGDRGNFRESLLNTQRGSRRFYQAPISAVQIAYGLKKHGSDTVYSGVAWGVLNQYGLCPKGSGLEMQERMTALEATTQRLLKDQISTQEFCQECFGLV